MLQVRDLAKQYRGEQGTVHAVRGVSFEVGEGEVVTLLGPSGCGKTTILRCVAGLERPDEGEIAIDGVLVSSRERRLHVPTPSRPIAIVFQSYAIWPHMTVWENVAYPLQVGRERLSKQQVRERVSQVLEMVRIPDMARRSATALSGGQQQRVAVARALVRRPKLLLLDEPLSNLDAKLREEVRVELKELLAIARISALYVTHDLIEALSLSDRIVVMEAGTIVQVGSPREVYARPQNQLAASFMGAGQVFEGTVHGFDGSRLRIDIGLGVLACPAPASDFAVGAPVLVAVRPESIVLGDSDSRAEGITLACVVEGVVFLGSVVEYRVRAQGRSLIVRAPSSGISLAPGSATQVHIPADSCLVLPVGPR
jgi:iron(III) transport system ATP-binding protein